LLPGRAFLPLFRFFFFCYCFRALLPQTFNSVRFFKRASLVPGCLFSSPQRFFFFSGLYTGSFIATQFLSGRGPGRRHILLPLFFFFSPYIWKPLMTLDFLHPFFFFVCRRFSFSFSPTGNWRYWAQVGRLSSNTLTTPRFFPPPSPPQDFKFSLEGPFSSPPP